MENPQALLPAGDFTLLALIVGLPLLGAFVNGVFGKRLGKQAVSLMALSTVGGSFLLSVVTFLQLHALQAGEEAARVRWFGWQWLQLSPMRDLGAPIPIDFALSADALSATMALIVTGISFLIHLYSTQYMAEDPSYHRFFSYLNLFVFSMLVLILGDNLPVLFVGWEGVGLCSYLLIGFWFSEDKNAAAGKKAFITNRIGDFGLLVGMALLLYYGGALDWQGLDAAAKNLALPVKIWPVGNDVLLTHLFADMSSMQWLVSFLNTPHYVSGATLVSLFFFLGAAGKSAQLPLYVWLPDAMAGPTPVSALIHAATMVTAGVYLLCRTSAIFVLSPAAMGVVALVGALTAVFAATIALVQNDIKKVLAYSTVSQLGYMFLGVGVGAFTAGFFHVITHAFFKACLFLGAGSVIHAMHARIHDTDRSQDMRHMGGLRRFMPLTFVTFVASWAAIAGLPFTSGFFSKDEILFRAFTSRVVPEKLTLGFGAQEIQLMQWPSWFPSLLFALGVAGAVMTAFYMSRLVIGTFLGDFRGWSVVEGWKPAHHGHDSHAEESHGHGHAHEEPGPHLQGPKPHESPWQMTLPLVVLGALALVGGALNASALFKFVPLDHWLEPVFKTASESVHEVPNAEHLELPLLVPGILAFLVGVTLAWWMYVKAKGVPAQQLAGRFPKLHALLVDKWRVDELYAATILGLVSATADLCVQFDRWVVDGIIARATAFVVAVVGTVLRYFQTGRVQAYAAVMVVGLGGAGWYMVRPHSDVRVTGSQSDGRYTITAAPGLGYSYRWDLDGDAKPDTESFNSRSEVIVNLARAEKLSVTLEVRNAFGAVSKRVIHLSRERLDLSGADRGVRIDLGGPPVPAPRPGAARPAPAAPVEGGTP